MKNVRKLFGTHEQIADWIAENPDDAAELGRSVIAATSNLAEMFAGVVGSGFVSAMVACSGPSSSDLAAHLKFPVVPELTASQKAARARFRERMKTAVQREPPFIECEKGLLIPIPDKATADAHAVLVTDRYFKGSVH